LKGLIPADSISSTAARVPPLTTRDRRTGSGCRSRTTDRPMLAAA
jgi:hypothetical protein